MQRYPFLSIIDRIDVGALQSFEHVDNLVAQLNPRIAKIVSLGCNRQRSDCLCEGVFIVEAGAFS